MDIFVLIVYPLLFIAFAFCLYMLHRNQAVYEYRTKVGELVSEAAEFDIENQRDWMWRYDYLRSVTYEEMMRKFWRPLDSFYEDMSFTNMNGRPK